MSVRARLGEILHELRECLAGIDGDRCDNLIDAVVNARSIFVSGAGRSGLAMKAFAMRLIHLGYDAHVVGETTTPSITAQDFHLIGSGSGSTASLVAYATKTRSVGAKIGLITAQEHSTLGHLADVVVTIPAPTPKTDASKVFPSAQPMGSLFEQALWLALDAIVLLLMEKTGADEQAMFARHANVE